MLEERLKILDARLPELEARLISEITSRFRPWTRDVALASDLRARVEEASKITTETRNLLEDNLKNIYRKISALSSRIGSHDGSAMLATWKEIVAFEPEEE